MHFAVEESISIGGAICALCDDVIRALPDRLDNAVILHGPQGLRAFAHPSCLSPGADAVDLPEERAFNIMNVSRKKTPPEGLGRVMAYVTQGNDDRPC